MSAVPQQPPLAYRLLAATALHKGDRPYQQDQVQILRHARSKDCLLAVLADGMGGKSGGRKAADQVLLTGRQDALLIDADMRNGAITLQEAPGLGAKPQINALGRYQVAEMTVCGNEP